ncbi:MAG: GNAT family N-acetyltransferase [Kofleriaceae bacterium]
MSIEVTIVRDAEQLVAIEAPWRALAKSAGSELFSGPAWLVPWWHAYRRALGAELHVLCGRADGELILLAPLYRRTSKVALLEMSELRLMGDAGPRPPALDILAAPGWEDRAGATLARALIDQAEHWDVIDLEPLADPSRVRANMVSRFVPAGFQVESALSAGGTHHMALAIDVEHTDGGGTITTYSEDLGQLRKGLSALRRLSRLEWAERDELSPLADQEAEALLEEVVARLHAEGKARVARLDDDSGEAIATALIVDDGDRAVVLAMGVDPMAKSKTAAARLLHAEAMAARRRGQVSLDVVDGPTEHRLPAFPTSRRAPIALKVWSKSNTAQLGRTYKSVAKQARRARDTPVAAAAQARAAWTRIRSAAAHVAHYDRFCLYRGQLWTRGLEAAADVTLAMFDEKDLDAMDPTLRAELFLQLALDEVVLRSRFRRGDRAVLASIEARPAGIAFCARGPVEAPELGRVLRLSKYDAYIHSVYVAAGARGRSVAPAMLEFLTRELRATDAYRSWALIAADNQASLRAFQKASFTPVCDVIHARMATVDRLILRPPDPEAEELLGL